MIPPTINKSAIILISAPIRPKGFCPRQLPITMIDKTREIWAIPLVSDLFSRNILLILLAMQILTDWACIDLKGFLLIQDLDSLALSLLMFVLPLHQLLLVLLSSSY